MKNQRFSFSLSSFAWSMYASLIYRLNHFFSSFIPNKILSEKAFSHSLKRGGTKLVITDGVYHFTFPVNEHPTNFHLRTNGSDIHVFQQVITGKSYEGLLQLYQNRKEQPLQIIDAGSNIGLTAIYLKRNFPASTIICLEPQESNFELLKKNIAANNLEGVYLYKKALWSKSVILKPREKFRDNLAWSFAVEESASPASSLDTVDGITLAQLKEMHLWEKIDILKMDIEGAEAVLFLDNDFQDALPKVNVIAIEIHEEMIKKEKVLQVLWSKNFLCFESGELTIAINQSWF
jgi:FkbM family methyltransferase